MKKQLPLLLIFSLLVTMAFSQQDTTFTKVEVEALKVVAAQYQLWKWVAILAGIIIPIGSALGLWYLVGKWAEDKAMEKLADKLNVKKEALEAAMSVMMKEHALKARKILIVSPTEGQPLTLTEFLKYEGFTNLEFIHLDKLATFTPAGIDLMLFNHLNQSLQEKESEFGRYLIKFKDNVRMLVLGAGQAHPKYKTELGNRLSFSNGFDTLSERILGAYKQPV